MMRVPVLLTLGLLLLPGCTQNEQPSGEPVKAELVERVYAIRMQPRVFLRILWQRSYPEEWQALVEQLQNDPDPFAEPFEVIPANVDPSLLGRLGWDRALVPRSFEELGYPLGSVQGAWSGYSFTNRTLQVAHTIEALNAFDRRFPEFEQIAAPELRRWNPHLPE